MVLENTNKEHEEALFQSYLETIVHHWLKIMYTLGITLIPMFLILDFFTMPMDLLPLFVFLRTTATVLMIFILLIIKKTRPRRYSYLFGYLFSLIAGMMIVLMTMKLGGFDSSYYAGLNLVIIGVNLLLPWKFHHSAFNGIFILFMYVVSNMIFGDAYQLKNLINNMYFLSGTVIITASISYVHLRLIKNEYMLRQDLRKTRDALWGEMEMAKKIQETLLPNVKEVAGYETAAKMIPADEVGGDYYDIIETDEGSAWISMGDVSGHGVESGLIMMMAQTAISTTIKYKATKWPSDVLVNVNKILNENIGRLKVDRYMTLILLHLIGGKIILSGRHLDLMIFRKKTSTIEIISRPGIWMGIFEDISALVDNYVIDMNSGDIILLYTDGITEAMNASGEMYGFKNLEDCFLRNASLSAEDIIRQVIQEVDEFQSEQLDDISVLVLKKR